MLTESARVVAVETDSVWVETIRKTTCGTCAAQKGCGHGLMNQYGSGKRSYIRVLPGESGVSSCRVDDEVLISIPEEVILQGSVIAYLMPLFCMLLGAVLAVQIQQEAQDMLAAVGAIVGLAVGFGALRWHSLAHRDDSRYQPVLLKILPST